MKAQTIQKISCNFCEKIQNFAKCKYTGGPDSIVVEPRYLKLFLYNVPYMHDVLHIDILQ